MSVSVDGTNERFPLPLRITLRLVRKRIIGSPMKPGYCVPENVAALSATGTARGAPGVAVETAERGNSISGRLSVPAASGIRRVDSR